MNEAKKSEQQETLGRLILWDMALDEVLGILHLTSRAKVALKQENLVNERNLHNARRSEFVSKLPGRKPGTMMVSDMRLYDSSVSRDFPIWDEVVRISDYLPALAVVYFGQIYGGGNKDSGAVAANNAMQGLRKRMEEFVVKQGIQENDLENLLANLTVVRDKTVAHADAKSFEMQHGFPISKINMLGRDVADLDLALWSKIATHMQDFVRNESSGIRAMLQPDGSYQ